MWNLLTEVGVGKGLHMPGFESQNEEWCISNEGIGVQSSDELVELA